MGNFSLFVTREEGVEEGVGHMVLRGNEERAKEKFNSHMPYLYIGAEQVCLREGEKLPIR